MKIAINKIPKNEQWGGGNQILKLLIDFFKKNNIEVSYSLNKDVRVVLMMDARDEYCSFKLEDINKFKNDYGIKVIHRINDNGSHRQNDLKRDDIILHANKVADKTIFISKWIYKYFLSKGFCGSYVIIDNASDKNVFYRKAECRKDKEPFKIVTHHWSNNSSKGYGVYRDLDFFCIKNPSIANFRFIGQNNCFHYFPNSEKISPQSYFDIPNYLNTRDVYISASLFESGGCHITEAMSCGLIPFVRAGGGGTENYTEEYNIVFNNSTDLMEKIKQLYYDYKRYKFLYEKVNHLYSYNSELMCKKYYKVIEEML